MSDRLSSIEAVMWNVGHEPFLRMTVGSLMFLDRPPARADLIKRLGTAAGEAQRLHEYPGRTFPRPYLTWVDDRRFDVRNHVRTMTIPLPGEQHQVLDLIALLEPIPFERDRSPWDATLIDGLEDGGAALYLRAHHVLTDGMGGIPLIRFLHDETGRQNTVAANRVSVGGCHLAPKHRSAPQHGDDRLRTGRSPSGIGLERQLECRPWRRPRARHPAQPRRRQLCIATGPCYGRLVVVAIVNALDGQPFRGHIGGRGPAAALSLGGSRNDLLVAAAAGGFGLYEALLGRSCPELRVASPTTLRHGAGIGGNWYAPLRVEVPTAVEHPGPQFGIVAERLARARSEPARSVSAALAAVLGRFPTRVLTSALSAQANTVDFAATTLPGFRGDHHVCGALIQRTYPFGPRLGCPMNISAFGNDGRLDVGIALDSDAIAEPDVMLECLAKAFDAFIPNPEPHPGGKAEAAGSPLTQGGEG